MSQFFCTKCGSKLVEGQRFCTVCGKKVPTEEEFGGIEDTDATVVLGANCLHAVGESSDADETIVVGGQAKSSVERETVVSSAFDNAGDTDATTVFGNAASSDSDDTDRYNMPINRSSKDSGVQYYVGDGDETIVLVHEEDECDTMVFGVSPETPTSQSKDETPAIEDNDETIVFGKHVIGTPVEGGGISVKYDKQPLPVDESGSVATRITEPDDDATSVLVGETDYDDDSTTVLTGPEGKPEPKEIVVYYLIRQSNDERFDLTVPAIVGKGSAATVRIPGNTAISRAHLEIRLDDETVKAKDLDTTNGSYVNGNKLESGVEVELNDQDIVKLADETFVFCVGSRLA